MAAAHVIRFHKSTQKCSIIEEHYWHITFIHSSVSSTLCNMPIPALLKGKTFKHEVDIIRISEFNYRQYFF